MSDYILPEQQLNYTPESLPNHLCPIPFTSLIFNPDGNVGCCRERTNHDSIGNITTQTVDEIWNGERIRAWRRELLSGKESRCSKYIKERSCNKQAINSTLLAHTSFTEYQDRPIIKISPDFNGECNLECIMCKIWQLPNGLYDKIGFWDYAAKNLFPKVQLIDPLAGEPFIQRDTFRLIKLMHQINPSCSWRFTTNGHWTFSDQIKEYLNMIPNLYGIQTSVDAATPALYAKIRKKGNLGTVIKNLSKQKEYQQERVSHGLPSFKMLVMMTVIRDNWHEIPQMCKLMNFLKIDFHFIKCNGPPEMELQTLPLKERLHILQTLWGQLPKWQFLKTYRVTRPLFLSLSEAERESFTKNAETFWKVMLGQQSENSLTAKDLDLVSI